MTAREAGGRYRAGGLSWANEARRITERKAQGNAQNGTKRGGVCGGKE